MIFRHGGVLRREGEIAELVAGLGQHDVVCARGERDPARALHPGRSLRDVVVLGVAMVIGAPPIAMAPSTLAALFSVIALVVAFSVVVPVVVQAAAPCVMASFSVTLTTPPVNVRLPRMFDALVSVMALLFSAISVTGTPLITQAAPCVMASFSLIAIDVGCRSSC